MSRPSNAMIELLKACASANPEVARNARTKVMSEINAQFTKALETPLKKGVLKGDIWSPYVDTVYYPPGVAVEFPYDLVQPGQVKEHVAYTMPNVGAIPHKQVEGDFVSVSDFYVASSIDTSLKYILDGRWDIKTRMLEVLEASVTKKLNNIFWQTVIAAIYGRNILVYDSAASAGFTTKALFSLVKTSMMRNGGGNSASLGIGQLTDFFLSIESMEDIRSWTLAEVDDITRREIFTNSQTGGLSRIWDVNLHVLYELGVGQEYQLYYTSTLGGSLAASDVEFHIGLDLNKKDSFLMPVREDFEVYEDGSTQQLRQNLFGLFTRGRLGMSVLDDRRVIAASS